MSQWESRAVTPHEAVRLVTSGMRVFVHGAAATPTPLLDALTERSDLEGVTLYHLHTGGPAPFVEPSQRGRFFSVSLFAGPPVREAIERGDADVIPIFLSDIPALFTEGHIPLDVAHPAAVSAGRPRLLHAGHVDRRGPRRLSERPVDHRGDQRPDAAHARQHPGPVGEGPCLHPDVPATSCTRGGTAVSVEAAIGDHVAALVEDGATLQMGIGAIPDAVLARLHSRQDLGIHTEMFSDGVVDLVKAGAVTNRLKHVHRGRIVTSFVNGSQRVYDFVHDNPFVEFHPCDRTNDTAIIRVNDKVTAINSALEVDLSGQVVADSIGFRIYSGIGGQMDFIHGAALSTGRQADHRPAIDGGRAAPSAASFRRSSPALES